MNTIIAVCGLRSEARLLRSDNIIPVIGGGDGGALQAKLDWALQGSAAGVVSFGLAAGLQRGRVAGDCVIASEVIAGNGRFPADEVWLQTMLEKFPQAWSGPIAGTDKILATEEDKFALSVSTKALAADMESHIAARAAQTHGIPFAAIRVISDDATHALPPAALNAMQPGGGIDIMRVLGSLVRRPSQLGGLIKTAGDAGKAMRVLLRCRNALGPRLGCPYLR